MVESQNQEKVADAPNWLWEAFDRYNADHFGGALERPDIFISFLSPRIAAATLPDDTKWAVMISVRVMDQAQEWPCDSLLHEMIHLALIAEDGDGDSLHGARFAATANRIGRALGLRDVAPESHAAKVWPQSVRPPEYPVWKGDDCPLTELEVVLEVTDEDEEFAS